MIELLKKNYLYSALLLTVTLYLWGCSSNSKEVAGGTEAESTIAVQVLLADGSPAPLARVRILPKSFLANGFDTISWDYADGNGLVDFGEMESGSYIVEARQVGEFSALGAVADIDYENGRVTSLNKIQMSALSSIEGFVAPGQGPSVVRIPGLDRFIVPDSSGYFVIDSLPVGDFDVLVESRSNRGSVVLQASSGDSVPVVMLGSARGFAVENFESFSGISATGKILGDGWWYTDDYDGEKLLPLWDESLTRNFSGRQDCASGGCARATNHLGFLLGLWKTDYALPGLDSLMFSARGKGKVRVALVYGDSDGLESGFEYEIELSKVWQGYSIPVSRMNPFGKAVAGTVKVSRIDFQVREGDTLYLDDVILHGVDEGALKAVATQQNGVASEYPDSDWKNHDALLKDVDGYASGVRGGAGPLEGSENVGEICVVTTTDDYVIVENSMEGDSSTSQAVVAPGSLRECASKDTSVWILFEKSGTYNLQTPLRVKANKTFDGRGRDIRITGMGVLTDVSENLIFENITFTAPAITAQDTSSRRALSIHNTTHHVWVDHCKFEEYPLVEMDIKRGSYAVTVSWSRFENAQSGILFGLEPDIFVDSAQLASVHHNYFSNMEYSGVKARFGQIHAYNNFFMDVGDAGIECTDSAKCLVEANVFNSETPVKIYRLFDEDGAPKDSTVGFPKMSENWFTIGGEELSSRKMNFESVYDYELDDADANLAWTVKEQSGPR